MKYRNVFFFHKIDEIQTFYRHLFWTKFLKVLKHVFPILIDSVFYCRLKKIAKHRANDTVLFLCGGDDNMWGCITHRYAPVGVGGHGGRGMTIRSKHPDSNLSYQPTPHAPRLLSIHIHPSLVSFFTSPLHYAPWS